MPGRILGVPTPPVHQHVLNGEEGFVRRRSGIQAPRREDLRLEPLNDAVDQERATGESEDCRDEQQHEQKKNRPTGDLRAGTVLAIEDLQDPLGRTGR